jgi:predicted acylesterase/phospholipase RssA
MAGHGTRTHGLVMQGGGALGSFELGVARALGAPECRFRPDVISGVSIGAINAVLMGRPRTGTGLETLERFWRDVRVKGWLATVLGGGASVWGVPGFYALDLPWSPFSTSLYDVAPLRKTLEDLVDTDALATPGLRPQLLLTALDVRAGKLARFDSDTQPLTLDHVLASGSLPPSFPPTDIGGTHYWDGGVFDNTPLGEVIANLDGDDPAVMVVNLFPNQNPLPRSLAEVSQVFTNVLFSNKTDSDIHLMERFTAVAAFMKRLDADLDETSPIRAYPEFAALLKYRPMPTTLNINRTATTSAMEGSDFSARGIEARAAEGERLTREALMAAGLLTRAPAMA